MQEAGIAWGDVDFVTFYEKPFLKFERLLETYLAFAPKGFGSFRMAMPLWLKEKLFQKSLLIDLLKAEAADVDWDKKLRFTEHHESHAASAFYPSPFGEAAILTMDGVGEWATTSMGIGSGNTLVAERGDPVSAFARAALLGIHLLHRLQGELRRIQGDGACALWRAEVRAGHHGQPDRHSGRRLVPHEHGLLRLLHRPDDDERRSSTRCSAGRRASPRTC